MAETIKGINVVIGAETKGLSAALSDVNKRSKDLQGELKQIDKLLKFDPGNTELLAQKQKILTDAISNTSDKLQTLKAAQQQVADQFARGDITEGQYRAFQRELVQTEQELKRLQNSLNSLNVPTINVVINGDTKDLYASLDGVNKRSKELQTELRQVDQLLKFDPGNTELLAQKQKLLSDAISNTSDKLNTLRSAQQQVTEQFQRGDISEEQYRAFQRELVRTEQELQRFENGLREARGELDDLSDEAGDAGNKIGEVGEKFKAAGDKIKGVGVGLTAGVTAPLVAIGAVAGKTAMDLDAAAGKMEASLGITAEEAEKLAVAAQGIWKNGFGESLGEVNQALITTKTNIRGLDDSTLTDLTQKAMILKETFDAEVNETTRTASVLMKNFKISGSDAMDLITVGFQRGGNFSDELLDTLREYSPQFKGLGYSAEQFTAILIAGAEKGAFNLDKIGDSAKEAFLRVGDGSKSSRNALTSLGLDFKKVENDINAGGQGAQRAFGAVVTAIAGVKDPAKQAQTAVALMGTPLEDLGPQFRDFFATVNTDLGNFKGSTDKAGAALKDNLGDRFNILIRNLQSSLAPLGETLVSLAEKALPPITQAVDTLATAFSSMSPSMQMVVLAIAGILAAIGPLVVIFGTIISSIGTIITAFSAVSGAFAAFGPVVAALTGPIGIAIAAITALVAGLTYLYNNNETVRNGLNAAWEAIKAAAMAIFGAIKDFWDQWGGQITELFQGMWDLVKSVFDTVINAIADVVKSVFDSIKAFWDKWGKDITTFFKAYLEGLKILYGTIFSAIFEAIKFIFNEIKAFWDKWGSTIVEAFKGIFTILNTIFGATFTAIFIVIKTVFTQIKAFWDTWGATITTLFKTVFDVVKTVFQGAWNTIKIVVETVIGVISGIIKTWLAVFKGDWAGAWENAKSVVTTIWNGIKALFKNAFQTMVKIGKDIIQGLINGIANMKDAVMKKTKEISEGMAEQIKRFFGIHSPSRLTTEYGEYISQGLANGIDNKSKAAEKSAKNTAKKVNDAFKESFASAQHKYKVGTLDTSQYIAALQGVQGQYAKTSAQYRKVTEEISKVNKTLTKEQEQALKQSFDNSKAWIDKQTQANQLSLTQQLVAWEKVQARYKAGSEQRKAAEEAAGKVRLEIYNQLNQAGDDFLAKTKAINENVAAEELRLNQVYEQAVEQRAKSINDFAGLFDAVVMKSETTGQQLLDNLRGQVDYLATWASSIETLAARGIDKGLLEELRQMGPKAAPELAALNQLTDSQLAEYSELWRTKSAESRAIAVQELQGIRQDTDLQIQQLRAKANTEMDGLKKDFEAKVKAIRSGTVGQFNAMKADLPTIGKQAMQGLLNGLSSMQGAVTAKAREIANSVRTTMQKALDIHSPSREMAWIGEMAGQGLVQGMAGMMSSVRQQAHEMAVAVQPSVSPAAGDTGANGVTNINMEGLFAGAVFNVRQDEDIKSLAKEMAYELFALTQGAARGAGGTR
ncbi:phage tail tape measure protein [Paenibacillus sp. FSL M8-0228]|uniref:phage tail tape measure protein n=1 Tax=Paenibacillus sp. FSL M8-0228 TaxID=2921620 RepID=UPI0030FAC840